jgi:hypothetical protein
MTMTLPNLIIVGGLLLHTVTTAISVAVSAACCHALQDPRSLGPFALFISLCGTGHLLRCLGKADTDFFLLRQQLTAFISLTTASTCSTNPKSLWDHRSEHQRFH